MKRISEILSDIDKTRGKHKKIAKIQENSKDIKTLLNYTFNPKIKWLLPEGVPPFKYTDDAESSTSERYWQEQKRLDKFMNFGPYPHMKDIRRQQLFIELLEYLHPDDADLLCFVKDKKLPYKSITKDLVEMAYPILAEKWNS